MSESKGQPVASSTTLVHKSDIDKAMPRNRAFAKVISTRTGPRLLDLPPEIRLMIFRHLLVLPIHLSHWMWSGNPFPNLGLMRTCKSIHKEAFDVLYKENLFDRWFWSRPCTLTRFPRVVDTIQDIHDTGHWDQNVFAWETFGIYYRLAQVCGTHALFWTFFDHPAQASGGSIRWASSCSEVGCRSSGRVHQL